MATLAVVTLLTVLDSLAKGIQLFEAGIGVSTSEPDTLAKGAANNVATLVDLADADVAGLVQAFASRADLVIAPALYRALQGERLLSALDAHYGGAGGLNATLTTAGKRVHPDVRKIGIQLDAVNAFPPEVVSLASFTVTGAGAGTYTAGTPVDRSLYGKANCVVRTATLIGATPIDVTCTMQKIDGTTESKVVTIGAGTASGTSVDIGTHDTDMYVACTLITITGGSAGESFTVRTEVERTVTL